MDDGNKGGFESTKFPDNTIRKHNKANRDTKSILLPDCSMAKRIRNVLFEELIEDSRICWNKKFSEQSGKLPESFWIGDSEYDFWGYVWDKYHLQEDSVLDAGCGLGTLKLFLEGTKRPEPKAIYLDLSATTLRKCKRNIVGGLCVLANLAGRLPFRQNSIDHVYSRGAICSSSNPLNALNSLINVSKNKITLLHMLLTEEETKNGFFELLHILRDKCYIVNVIEMHRFISIIARNGYKIKEISKSGNSKLTHFLGYYEAWNFHLQKM